jgi:hypothetical protein
MKKYQPLYWNQEGKYQEDYNRIYNEKVPSSGRASTSEGEILRAMSNIYYDHMNNGGGNLSDVKLCNVYILSDLMPEELKEEVWKFGNENLCYDEWGNEVLEGMKFADKFVDKIMEYLISEGMKHV